MRARREAGEVLVRRTLTEKAAANPRSLRLAISAKCFTCVGEDQDPGFRDRIRTCSVTRCPLHGLRPYQRNSPEESEETEDE